MQGIKNLTYRDLQARLHALGFNPGAVDGINGPKTTAALHKACRHHSTRYVKDLFHKSGLHRIHLHWTAGAYGDISLERSSYHILILEDGKIVMGDLKPEANADTRDGQYAAHTRAANSGSIGVSLDAMGGAMERPFTPGRYPITSKQLDSLADVVADLSDTYWIPVSRYSILTHAEVEPTLGIKQRNKWDITWIPGMSRPGDPIAVGDKIRAMVERRL